MADLDSEFRFLVGAVQRSVELLRQHPELPRVRDGERGSALLSHVKSTLNGIEAKVADAVASFDAADDYDKREFVKQIRLLHSSANFTHKAVPWITSAARPQLALGALYFIDEVGNALCGAKPDAIPVPGTEYSTERWPFRDLFAALGLPKPAGPTPVVLNFPAREATTHLLLPIYGHELGHAPVGERGLANAAISMVSKDPAFAGQFNLARSEIAKLTNGTEREAGVALGWQLQRWTTELLCDQFGAQALGASFLYAFASYMLSDSWEDPGERHPPTNIRLDHVLAYLSDAEWTPVLERHTPNVLSWLREVAATPPRGGDPGTDFLLGAVNELQPFIREIVANELQGGLYPAKDFEAAWPGIAELVEYETLPAQAPSGDAYDRRAILIAAWLSAFDGSDTPGALTTAPSDHRSQAFFAKAIEMSSILRRWQELA